MLQGHFFHTPTLSVMLDGSAPRLPPSYRNLFGLVGNSVGMPQIVGVLMVIQAPGDA